ncbi:MAG: protein translocase subunit SecD [Gammaproteobacteria bacterium]|nr:protein translocase subunit SecD [Gammaproteobacteria bacterium]NNF48253.1 protein translocase subunit SecD [Woeseiaceae bacterium]MBT8094939.1 protein translocase subunit SecD [Gammaproteobacteria bacterium]MBT8105460.1 protein translocase subunit SecD [Gammaproteobacteria bacterium]NNK25474.1 protein translocase subunit SecD [Woeseiaceae bacterium]
MNKFPAWLNTLVLLILLAGCLFALPNLYGSVDAIQIASTDDAPYAEDKLDEFVAAVTAAGVSPQASYLQDGRVVMRFDSVDGQEIAAEALKDAYSREASVAKTLAPALPDWMRKLGFRPMSLGLDLRGGVYVLLEVDMNTAIQSRLAGYEQSFDDRLREARIRHRVDIDGDTVKVRLTSPEDLERARDIIGRADQDLLIVDGADGKSMTVRMSAAQIQERQDFAIEQNLTTLRNRVNQLGVAEPLVQREGVDRIVVQLPGVQDPNQVIDILKATATIEFRMVDPSGDEPGSRRYAGRGEEPSQVLKRKVIASGDQIIDARMGQDQGRPIVSITLDSAGGESMLETTMNNLKKPMSTVFIETTRETITRNGVEEQLTTRTEEIISTATIQGVFKDRFQISGLAAGEAAELALLLRAGALAAPVYPIDERTIGPSLGQDNIDRGFNAIKIGFLAVIVFMAIYYRAFGLIADVALFSNLVFIVALLSILGASLTLPGIAGIVLTVGMAVDANVLIFERIREELSGGASPQAAIDSGYGKALSSIVDANVTTLIAAIVLFALGTGPIKGFAITLLLGIITSMFTAIVGTRTIVNLVWGGRKLESLPV